MSFLKNLASVFGGSQATTAAQEELAAKDTSDASKSQWRQMTRNEYKLHPSSSHASATFDLRYSAYGEVSTLLATHVILQRPGTASLTVPNAISMDIDFENQRAASITLVNDVLGGFASEKTFPSEIAAMRAKNNGRIGEITGFEISKDHKSRRAIAALLHVLYLYSRQARQMTCIFVQTETARVSFYEQMLGFKKLATAGDMVLLSIDLTFMKQQIRTWGGKHKDKDAEQSPYKLYPFFFPSRDEAGLLFRVLEHLGSSAE